MELGNNLYKIKKNLHINKNYVISYETKVARIEEDRIVCLGIYSRTTGKHISFIGDILGLPVDKKEAKKKDFCWFDYGADVNFKKSISSKGSKMILGGLKKNGNYKVTVASLSKQIPKKDWEILDKRGVNKELLKSSILLKRSGIL